MDDYPSANDIPFPIFALGYLKKRIINITIVGYGFSVSQLTNIPNPSGFRTAYDEYNRVFFEID